MAEKFFDKVYDLKSDAETREFYDRWSGQYEADVAGAGYATPGRLARLLAAQMPDRSQPVLDLGCGTGLSGVALAEAGFRVIDGVDPSGEMLAMARAKGVYRNLDRIEPGAALPEGYAAITAIGVIGCGAAPVSVFDDAMAALAPGALFALSFNDHALAEPEYPAKLASYTDTGRARLLAQDYGAHLPDLGSNSMSMVYVLQKT